MANELKTLENILQAARETGNVFVAEGKLKEALVTYEDGLKGIRQQMATAAMSDGTKIDFEPIPLQLNAAFCAAALALQCCQSHATISTKGDIKIVEEPSFAEAASKWKSVLRAYLSELSSLGLGFRAQTTLSAKVSSNWLMKGNSQIDAVNRNLDLWPKGSCAEIVASTIPQRYVTEELHAKVHFRRAQVLHALSRLAFLEALCDKPEKCRVGVAARPLNLAVYALEDFRRCELLHGEIKTAPHFQEVRHYLFDHCSHLHPAVDKRFSAVHGVGLVAAADIPVGSLLLVERPAILVDSAAGDYEQRFVAAIEQVLRWQKSGEQGSRPHRSLLSYLALHADPTIDNDDDSVHVDQSASISPDILCDVWLRNSMRLTNVDYSLRERQVKRNSAEAKLAGGAALYIDASRCNHSCYPNTLAYFDLKTFPRPTDAYNVFGEVNLMALRDIKAGEELFISYTSLLSSKEKKRKHLKFPCRCAVCSGDPSLQQKRSVEGDVGNIGGELEAIVCPMCGALSTPVRTGNQTRSESGDGGEEFHCALCEQRIPFTEYIQQVSDSIQSCTATINTAESSEEEYVRRSEAARILCGVYRSAKLLGPSHYLRCQVGIEALSCVAGLPPSTLSTDLKDALVDVSQTLVTTSTRVCPAHWPLSTGLTMHLAYLLARFSSAEEDRGRQGEGGRCKAISIPQVGDLICKAFDAHYKCYHPAMVGPVLEEVLQNPDRETLPFSRQSRGATAIDSFLVRYREELQECGIENPKDFEAVF